MVKSKKNLILVMIMVLVLAMGTMLLVACDGNKVKPGEYNVTFMVKENGNGAWKEVATVKSNAEGVVSMPKDPAIPGYSFRAWYTDEACQNKFDGTNVTADMKVYAFMSDKLVTVNIKNAAGEVVKVENQTVAGLNTLEETEGKKALEANLTFDGFYTNEGYTTKFDINSESTVLYARYAAVVNFVDGYSNIEYKQVLNPGEKMAAVDEANIKMSYMDSIYGYTEVDANGKTLAKDENGASAKFDFDSKINKNTTLSVLWASKGLKFKANKHGAATLFDVEQDKEYNSVLRDIRVLRIPEYVLLKDETEPRLVDTITWGDGVFQCIDSCEKIIVPEGVKVISGFNNGFGSQCAVKEIVIPESTKIIDTAFNNLDKLESVTIPDGVEVVIDSFWYKRYNSVPAEGYPFEIKVPTSVKHIAITPENFKFAENSPFFYKGDALYKKGTDNNYETLVRAYNMTGDIVVKEGVKYIQAGALIAQHADYITIPSTFVNVAYNAKAEDYPYYEGGVDDVGTGLYHNGFRLAGEKSSENGRSMLVNLEDSKKLLFKTTAMPEGLANDAIKIVKEGDWKTSNFHPNPYVEDNDLVVYVGKIADGQNATVKVRSYYAGELQKTVSLENIKSNSTMLTKDMILEAVGLKGNADYFIKSIKQFGKDYFVGDEAANGKKVNCNQYIELVYDDTPAGAKIEDVNGVMTVTGFDKATAKYDSAKAGYVVTIPSDVNGKPVEAIAAEAFKGNGEIIQINIPSGLKNIGDRAFQLASKLTMVRFGKNSKLETIGVSAFEDTAIKTLALPLTNLKDVKPYAFRTATLEKFLPVAEDGELTNMISAQDPTKFAGHYAFGCDYEQNNVVLYKVNSGELRDLPADHPYAAYGYKQKYYDADLVAICGGMKAAQIAIGVDYTQMTIIETTVLEGSVCYLGEMFKSSSSGGVIFTKHIKKMSENAFTRIDDQFLNPLDSKGNPKPNDTHLRMPKGYGYNAGDTANLTVDDVKALFLGDAFKNEDGTLVKWFDGKEFGEADIAKLPIKSVQVDGTMHI